MRIFYVHMDNFILIKYLFTVPCQISFNIPMICSVSINSFCFWSMYFVDQYWVNMELLAEGFTIFSHWLAST